MKILFCLTKTVNSLTLSFIKSSIIVVFSKIQDTTIPSKTWCGLALKKAPGGVGAKLVPSTFSFSDKKRFLHSGIATSAGAAVAENKVTAIIVQI